MTSGPSRPSEKRASDVAARVLGKLDRTGTGMKQARAIAAWREVAGEEVCAHTRGFHLRDTELLVFVDASVWANELSVLSEHYRVAVNERLGKELVGSIRFDVSKRVEQARRWEAELEQPFLEREGERAEPVPATETELAQIRHMASVVKNERVREAVIAAAIRNLEWRKGLNRRKEAEEAVQRPTEAKKPPEHKDLW